MCGIFGIISKNDVTLDILSSLKLLEYRGYDSAGVVTIDNNTFQINKAIGKLHNLQEKFQEHQIHGVIGLGHIRWATHGAPTINNTHPIMNDEIAVVHNGIIENYQDLKKQLIVQGYQFTSDTDTEVVLHLLDYYSKNSTSAIHAVLLMLKKIKGLSAIGILFRSEPNQIIAVQNGLPLVVAVNEAQDACYIASDVVPIAQFCHRITYLKDKQIAVLQKNQYQILDFEGCELSIETAIATDLSTDITKNGYNHFMIKEIYQQPFIIKSIFENHDKYNQIDIQNFAYLTIVACGSSMYAGLIVKSFLENTYDVRVRVEIASEFNIKNITRVHDDELFIFISQSGETADTIACIKMIKKLNGHTLGIVNHAHSSIASMTDSYALIDAGNEFAVAATKSFLAQIATLYTIFSKYDSINIENKIFDDMWSALKTESKIEKLIHTKIAQAHKLIFIGKGIGYALSMEGALKVKELVYINAEGIAAGELKHGSLALIDSDAVVIAIAPCDYHFTKMIASINEIKARNGVVIMITDSDGIKAANGLYDDYIEVPKCEMEIMIPFVYAPILQLISYHFALLKGYDIDKPRNLAKSVTVE